MSTGPTRGTAPAAGVDRRSARWAWIALAAMAAVTLGFWLLLQAPMDVPDAATPTVSNYVGSVDAGNSVAQTFVPERNDLDGILLVLSTEELSDTPSLTFRLHDGGPDGPLLRVVKVPVASLPEGDAFKYRPGSLDERWTTIKFEPIANSAGRPLYFELDGRYVPEQNRVRTLLMFPSKYSSGAGFVNGVQRNAHVVFRSTSRGQVRGYLWTIARNLTAGKPGPLANPLIYVGLGAVYVALLAVLFVTLGRSLRLRSR